MTSTATGGVDGARGDLDDGAGLPAGLAAPARRALAADGYARLEDLAGVSDEALLNCTGWGRRR